MWLIFTPSDKDEIVTLTFRKLLTCISYDFCISNSCRRFNYIVIGDQSPCSSFIFSLYNIFFFSIIVSLTGLKSKKSCYCICLRGN